MSPRKAPKLLVGRRKRENDGDSVYIHRVRNINIGESNGSTT